MLASNLRASATSPRSIRCLPTSAQTALCRWLWFRQPHNELLFYVRPHLRWSSNDSQVADPDIGLSEKLRSRTSLDLALELRGVEVQASRNNGRNALDVFRALDESDGYRMLLKGIRCLQAYHGLISPLSINHAREIIVKNEAGKVVQDWLFQPQVQSAIESNPQENRVLLPLVAYVLVGAGEAREVTRYHAWTRQHRNITLTMPLKRKAVIKEYLWTDIARYSLISAFIAWHPKGLADAGYNYFSTEFEEYKYWLYNPSHKNTDGLVVPYFPWENTMNMVSQVYINKLHPASSDSFERAAKQLLKFWRRADPIMYLLDRALMPHTSSKSPIRRFIHLTSP
ncbi:hypothetical protein NPX13_g4252 [Xylaria arbuscula]|uniref:Uncharacterized protein n=1 Tax=Xylaria arbuscula TaxID=114810 RepID=A0A9W8NGE1_9PEZI|nr:hypothetical protein NPX13_g4252 [Xylaria arbuscula]